MLIEFSVQNHRAFCEKQTFSMVASPATERNGSGHVVRTGFSSVPYVLREACIFGANGSGKSSLIDAMAFMSRFVRTSFNNEADQPIDVDPFIFHNEWKERPSEFEVIFIYMDTLYQYGFSVTQERVAEEWLFARPRSTGRQRQIFTRTYDTEKRDYEWEISSTYLKGERDSWKSQTRKEALFLSTAVQLNADGLKAAHEWLVKHFRTLLLSSGTASGGYTATRFNDPDWKTRVINFLEKADISINDIKVDEKDFFDTKEFKLLPKPLQGLFSDIKHELKSYSIQFVRKNNVGSTVDLDFNEESSGTKSLFELSGPILDVLEKGLTVTIDELNSGVHPLALKYIISMFCDLDINKYNAQLIFTTHDTAIVDLGCIGRDQIWLTEKSEDLSARLIPFSDFKTRDVRAFQKAYLQGRYGAIPKIMD